MCVQKALFLHCTRIVRISSALRSLSPAPLRNFDPIPLRTVRNESTKRFVHMNRRSSNRQCEGGHNHTGDLAVRYSVVFSFFQTCSARAMVYSAATAGAAARLAATCLAMVSNSRWPVCVMKRPLHNNTSVRTRQRRDTKQTTNTASHKKNKQQSYLRSFFLATMSIWPSCWRMCRSTPRAALQTEKTREKTEGDTRE